MHRFARVWAVLMAAVLLSACHPVPVEDLPDPDTQPAVSMSGGVVTPLPTNAAQGGLQPDPTGLGRLFRLEEIKKSTVAHVRQRYDDGGIPIDIDAEVWIPGAKAMPCYTVKAHVFPDEWIRNTFFEDPSRITVRDTSSEQPQKMTAYQDSQIAVLNAEGQGLRYTDNRLSDLVNNAKGKGALEIQRSSSGQGGADMPYTREQAIQMVADMVRKAQMDQEYDLGNPLVEAYTSSDKDISCYYTVRFPRVVDGVVVYDGQFNRPYTQDSTVVLLGEYFQGEVYRQGLLSFDAEICDVDQITTQDTPMISLDKALSIVQGIQPYLNPTVGLSNNQVSVFSIRLVLVNCATQPYNADGNYKPFWVFEYRDAADNIHSLRVNAMDGTCEVMP